MCFESTSDFYYVAILKRKADDPDATKSVKVVDQYCIYSKEELDKRKADIIKDCDSFNARAYIYVNRRNIEKVALESIRLTTEYVIAGDSKAARGAFWKAVGRRSSEPNKKWVVDVDTKSMLVLHQIKAFIKQLHEAYTPGYQVLDVVPTKNGYHIITEPFNIQEFRVRYPEVDVHKDNPTLLYVS